MVKKMLSGIPSGHDGDGYVTLNGKVCAAFKISSVSAEVKVINEKRRFLGERMVQNAPRGMEGKGRIAYYVMVGIVCAASVIASRLLGGDLQIQPTLPLGAVCLASIVIYALGWYLSVRFYQKREF